MAERVQLEFTDGQKVALVRAARSNAWGGAALFALILGLQWMAQGDWRMALMKAAFMPLLMVSHLGLSLVFAALPRTFPVRLAAIACASLAFACLMLILFVAPDKSVSDMLVHFWSSLLIMAVMVGATDLVTRGRWLERWLVIGVPK